MHMCFIVLFGHILLANCITLNDERCHTCMSIPTTPHEEGTFDCSYCQLENVPPFPRTAIYINLSFNRIKFINKTSFLSHTNLARLNLNSNNITLIEKGSLCILPELQELDLSQNALNSQAFRNITFCAMEKLKILHIEENNYTTYPESSRSHLSYLQTLSLDVFNGFKFGEWFKTKIYLKSIIFNARERFHINNNSFEGLQNSPIYEIVFDFHDSLYKNIGIGFMRSFRFLKSVVIDIGMTNDIRQAVRLVYGLRGLNLNYLEMRNNYMSYRHTQALYKPDVRYLRDICVKELSMYNNALIGFPFEFTMNSTFSSCIEKISLADPVLSVWSQIRIESLLSYPKLLYLYISQQNSRPMGEPILTKDKHFFSNSVISRSSKLRYSGTKQKTVSKMKSTYLLPTSFDLQFNVTARLPSNLTHVEILSVDTEYVMSSLLYDLETIPYIEVIAPNLQELKLINTKANICAFPYIEYKTDLRIVNLTGSNCKVLNPKFLASLSSVRELCLSKSYFGDGLNAIENNDSILWGLTELQLLDLSYSGLKDVPVDFLRDQKSSLRQVYLRGNQLTRVPTSLNGIKNLQYVDFRNNPFVFFTAEDIVIMEDLKNTKFDFNENTFDCSCNNVETLTWMSENRFRFTGTKSVLCIGGNTIDTILTNIRFFRLGCAARGWRDFAIVMNVLLLITLILGAAGYRNKTLVIYFYLRMRQWVFKQTLTTDDKIYEYDLFLSYSASDTEWAVGTLYKYMNDKLNLAVSLQDKDCLPGRYLAEEIMRCIDVSRRTMFVITYPYLNTEFSVFEIEIARRHVFRKDDRNILMIMKDPVCVHEMPDVLKKIWWRVVCLEYPQSDDENEVAIFWEKLKDAVQQ